MKDLPRLKIGTDIVSKVPVYIEDRYTHILLMGKSGTGKSTSIINWWETDHLWKNSKVLVDPSGFLARDAYSIISGGMYCSIDNPISINLMLAPYTPDQISEIYADAINKTIKAGTEDTIKMFTPKMRVILDEEIKYCLNHNRKSLLHVLDRIKTRSGDNETRDGIISRMSFVLNDKRMENLLCGSNSIEWGELIQKKQTFILDCFGMGSEKMLFTGNIITNAIKSFFRYARPNEYRPLSLYIDECHNFVNPGFFDILKEGRKYKLSCVLATQDFATIDERLARVMLNVGTIVSYRLGHREARLVANEIDITPQQLQFIEKYHVAYATAKAKGIAKAPRPVWITRKEPPTMEEPLRKPIKVSWFDLEPLEPLGSSQTAGSPI